MKTNLGDQLVIFCYTFVQVQLEISGLTRDIDGNIRAFGPEPWLIDGVIEGDIEGGENEKVVPALIDGELLAVNVSTPDRNLQAGECYIRGAIRTQMYDTPRYILFADYISLPSPLSYPGSPVVSALGGPGLFKFADLENGVDFEVPGNSMIKILHLYAQSQGTAAGNIVVDCQIMPQDGYIAFAYNTEIAVNNESEIARVNFIPGGSNQDLTSKSIAIPDNRLIPGGLINVGLGGVSDPTYELIQIGYMQWIYPYAIT